LNGLIAMLKHGSGLAPKQSESRFAGITSLSVQGVLAMNPGTWQKVLLGGVVNLSMDMDYADLAAGIAIAPTISMEEIESASGYLWQRNANSANDRRAFTRDDSVGGNRLAGGLTSSARGFIAAYRNLMLAIRGSIEGQPVERAAAVKDAANQFVRAFDPGMLNLLDQEVIRIAVAGHLHRVRIENPDMAPADQMAIAVRRAEMTIRRTQNVSSPIDDSRLVAETTVAGDPLTRALLPFASDPLKSASRLYEGLHQRSPMSTGKWASAAVANAIVGVWANWTVAAVSALLSGDDEEYERLAAEAAKQRTIDGLGGAVLSEIVGRTGVFGFAVGGDAVEMMYRKTTDREGFPPDVNLLLLDTAGRTVSDLARFAESAESPTGADLKRGYRGLVGLSQISGLPAPLLRRMENLLPESYRDALKAERIIKGMGRELTPEEADVVSRARSEMRELRELDELRKEMGF
jgi:hypothetical protein